MADMTPLTPGLESDYPEACTRQVAENVAHLGLVTSAKKLNAVADEIARLTDAGAAEREALVRIRDSYIGLSGHVLRAMARRALDSDEPPISADEAIQAAVDAVERMGADERLTRAVILLGDARRIVVEYAAAPLPDGGT